MPTLLDNLDTQPVESWNRPVNTGAAERLRTTMAACRVQFTWWGVQRTLTAEQKAQAAQAIDAEGEFLSAGKKAAGLALQPVRLPRDADLPFRRFFRLPLDRAP